MKRSLSFLASMVFATTSLSISVEAALASPRVPDSLIDAIFGEQGAWSPQGTIVADSGFRPYPNGFGFLNFGTDLSLNQILFAQPVPLAMDGKAVRPASLTPADMRASFGPEVCTARNSTGPCELTFSAAVVRDLTTDWAINGRCFGMSNVAAALYSEIIDPSELKTGEVNSFTPISDVVQRRILRTVASQYFSATGSPVRSMQSLVNSLASSFSQGTLEHTLLLYGVPGGHGVTPYAIYDRGEGLYDIAVYDSNIPNQARAIRVNVNTNSFEYEGNNGLYQGPSLWSSAEADQPASIWLGSVANAVGPQACTFCARQSSLSIVTFSPILRENAALLTDIKVLDSSGQPLDPALYTVIAPIDSVPGPFISGAAIQVQAGIPFAVALSGSEVRTLQPLTVTIIRDGTTRQVRMDALSAESSSVVGVGAAARTVSIVGRKFEKINVRQTVEFQGASYSFKGVQLTGGKDGGLFMRLSDENRVVILKDNRGKGSTWKLDLESSVDSSKSRFTSKTISVPAGGRILVDYSRWRGSTGAPSVWLDLKGGPVRDVRVPVTKR